MNKHGGYATGQLVALNLFRKRIGPSWQMLPRNCCLTQFAFVVIPKHLWFTKQERILRKSYGTLRLFRTFYNVQVVNRNGMSFIISVSSKTWLGT